MNLMAVGRTASTASTDTATKLPTDTNNIGSKENFLQLLIAQIKNQNPLNPQDGTQFLSQLNQFTATEQMLGMRQDLAAIRTALEGAKTAATDTKA
jgi:flagellar basal-body rod modification protein FlgD